MKLDRSVLEDTLLVGTLVWFPFAFGGVHTWAWCLMALTALVLFDARFLFSGRSHKLPAGGYQNDPGMSGSRTAIFKEPASVLVISFVVLTFFYIVPVPAYLIRVLSPKLYELRASYALHAADNWQTFSVYPRATIGHLIKISGYAMFYFVVVSKITNAGVIKEQETARSLPRSIYPSFMMFGAICGILSIIFHGFADFNLQIPANTLYFTVLIAVIAGISGRRRGSLNYSFLDKMVATIVITGFSVALFGIIQRFGWNGKMFWLVEKRGGNFGPFVSYNNFAGFMQLTTFMAISMFYAGIFTSPLRRMRRLKDRIVWFSSPEANKTLLYLFMSVVMTGGLFLSSSKAGIICFALSFTVFVITCVAIGPKSRKAKIVTISFFVVSLITAMAIWLGPDNTIRRFKNLSVLWEALRAGEQSYVLLRFHMWIDTIKVITNFPLTGTGPGTFSDIFPIFRTFPTAWGFLRHAHQDYLQFFTEMGSVGGIFLIMFFIWYFRRFRECLKRLSSGAQHLEETI